MFDAVPISVAFVSEIVTVSRTRIFHEYEPLMRKTALLTSCFSWNSAKNASAMTLFVVGSSFLWGDIRFRTDGSVQLVQLVIEPDHRFINRNSIRNMSVLGL